MTVPTQPSSENFLCDHCTQGFFYVRDHSKYMKSTHPAAYFSERGRLAPSCSNWTAQADALLHGCASAVVQVSGPLALCSLARKDLLMGEEHLPEAAPRLDEHALSVLPRRWQLRISRRPTAALRPTASRTLSRAQYEEVQARLAENPKAGAHLLYDQLPQSLLHFLACGVQLKDWAIRSWPAWRTPGPTEDLLSIRLRMVVYSLPLLHLPAPIIGSPPLLGYFRGFTNEASTFGVAGKDLMETVNAGKVRHYSIAELQENLRSILGRPADFPVSHEPTFFSSLGTLHPRSEARLQLLGVSKLDLSDLCLVVMRGSLKV
ncbi:unnamed protein product [Schistocephalus solidus]|uniref:C2H2-type domain-containing protein n=1 Tax=Schistocephalus solidus TaxID=70667 RepID=A0A183TMA6_SCHSO|nr:unnamed protein product [Schistocephalus solidus]